MGEVNLNETEQRALREMALRTGKTEGELIHDAVAKLLNGGEANQLRDAGPAPVEGLPSSGNTGILRARGMWKDRDDLPDFGKLRREWDRL
jgi:hypothetical protein